MRPKMPGADIENEPLKTFEPSTSGTRLSLLGLSPVAKVLSDLDLLG